MGKGKVLLGGGKGKGSPEDAKTLRWFEFPLVKEQAREAREN